ncbi:MAG: type I glyceraldehyde-3-phosphate dehydrogenase [Planctomycetes bacterium]|nr:type I glyceraldehyde-3-phosphate dehydrogenase [Planctomycetota bacterium]
MNKKVAIGINGFGRIGASILRAIFERDSDLEIAKINDLTETRILAALLRNDSVKGRFPGEVEFEQDALLVNGKRIPVSSERDPARLDWSACGERAVVVESTGVFRSQQQCMKHVQAGAERVVLTVPPSGDVDFMAVVGVNDDKLTSDHKIISNASCTTNSIGVPLRVLNEALGVKAGLLTTVHSATNDQNVCDAVHEDLRRARSVLGNLIPTTTGAAKAIGKVIDGLDDLNGGAIRTPTLDGSVSVLDLLMKKSVTAEQVNKALKDAATNDYPSIMAVVDHELDEIVSSDIVGRSESAIIDTQRTMVVAGELVQLYSWYDNEWGYSNRCVDLLEQFATWK